MKPILTILLILFLFFKTFAQENSKITELREVQIQANRAKIYPDASRVVNIIEKSEIEILPVKSLDELLDNIAGIDARQRGAGGVQTDVSMHGGTFDQVLILLNGVNITDPQTGHHNLNIPIDLNDISRIEILQGSAARIYGPNAFSGAINIITSETNKNKISSHNEVASYGTWKQNISGNYFSENFQTFASASYIQSDGYTKNTDYKISNALCETKINTSKAGYYKFQVAVQTKDFGANGFYTLKYPNQFESTKTLISSLEWNIEKDFYSLNAQAYWRRHHDRFELFRNFSYAETWYKNHNYHQTDIFGGKIATNLDWKMMGKTTVGIDLRNEHIFSNILGNQIITPRNVPFGDDSVFFNFEDNRLLITSVIDHTIKVEQWNFAGGISTTFNKQFHTQINGGIDIGYKWNKNLKLFATLNSAVRLPTFTDLYYKSATQLANPNLKPEKSLNVEVGSKYNVENFTSDVDIYHRWGKNIIDWIKKPEETKWKSANITNVNATGLDVNMGYKLQKKIIKSISISYSYLNLNKKATEYDSKYALDYLKHKFVIGINHKITKNVSANWNVRIYDRAGNYTDFFTNQLTDYKPYTLLNNRILWSNKNIDLYLDLNNILNQNYIEFGGLEQPKINYNLGIVLKI